MKRKNIFITILCCLCMIFAFGLSGCGEETPGGKKPSNNSTNVGDDGEWTPPY